MLYIRFVSFPVAPLISRLIFVLQNFGFSFQWRNCQLLLDLNNGRLCAAIVVFTEFLLLRFRLIFQNSFGRKEFFHANHYTFHTIFNYHCNYHCKRRSYIRQSGRVVFFAYTDICRVIVLFARCKIALAGGGCRYCSLATAFDSVSRNLCSVPGSGCPCRCYCSGIKRISILCRHSLFVCFAINRTIIDCVYVHCFW